MVKVVDFKGQNYDKLKKECAHSTELFTDSLFPPGNESLNLNPESSIRLGNNAVEWKRITVKYLKFIISNYARGAFKFYK